MRYDAEKILDAFTIRAEERGMGLYELSFICELFTLSYLQRLTGSTRAEGWTIRTGISSTGVSVFDALTDLNIPALIAEDLGLNPLEADLWVHDLRLAIDPLLQQAQAALTVEYRGSESARWADFAFKLKTDPGNKS